MFSYKDRVSDLVLSVVRGEISRETAELQIMRWLDVRSVTDYLFARRAILELREQV